VAYLPGLFNVLTVALSVTLTPLIGIATFVGTSFAASGIGSIVLDSFGVLGMPKIPLSKERAIGAAIMFVGMVALQKVHVY
jgi:transporter family-2 protein